MKIVVAKFERVYKVADYESERYVLEANVDDGESAIDVLASLKADVAAAYVGDGDSTKVEATKETESKGKSAKSSKKSSPKPAAEPEEEDEEETEDAAEEVDADDESEEEDESEDADDEETEDDSKSKKTSASKSAPKTETKKTTKSKTQNYDREVEQHKEIFSTVLKGVAPDWKKTAESKVKAKKASQKMHGKEFLDANGDVVKEFKLEVKKLMVGK